MYLLDFQATLNGGNKWMTTSSCVKNAKNGNMYIMENVSDASTPKKLNIMPGSISMKSRKIMGNTRHAEIGRDKRQSWLVKLVTTNVGILTAMAIIIIGAVILTCVAMFLITMGNM